MAPVSKTKALPDTMTAARFHPSKVAAKQEAQQEAQREAQQATQQEAQQDTSLSFAPDTSRLSCH